MDIIFDGMPPSFLSSVVFCDTSYITASYICKHLALPRDGDGFVGGYPQVEEYLINWEKKVLTIAEVDGELTKTGALPELLHDWEKDEAKKVNLLKFVSYATAYNFIPADKMIVVEFSNEECDGMHEEDALPMAHTCTCEIKIPMSAYHGDKDMLESKLLMAFEYAGASMQMV
jgi:HECT-domain (ubiquitin-transferase)